MNKRREVHGFTHVNSLVAQQYLQPHLWLLIAVPLQCLHRTILKSNEQRQRQRRCKSFCQIENSLFSPPLFKVD